MADYGPEFVAAMKRDDWFPAPDHVCPRCLGPVPSAEDVGQYQGAGSRMTVSRSVEICSACGTDEAIGGGLVGMDAWPIVTDTTPRTVRSLKMAVDSNNRADAVDPRYRIVRYHKGVDKEAEVVRTGVSLREAQAHCRRDDTHGDGWFDGYTEEP